MRTMRWWLAGACLAAGGPLGAQGGTDVWVVGLTERGTQVGVGTPANLTKRPGYDNQPAFTPDGAAVLYTRIDGSGPADIWRAPLDGGAPARLTRSDIESEYSATPMPDGSGFSVIRVEADSTQRLWAFGWDGAPSRTLLPALKPVGYHVWIGRGAIGAFVLGSPNALVLANPQTERVDTLARRIGRAFARVPGREAFTFVQVEGDSNVIAEVDTRTGGVQALFATPPRGEYHVWTLGGRVIASAGSRLYLRTDGRWDVLADFAAFGVRDISRLAMNPAGDMLAFVAADAPR